MKIRCPQCKRKTEKPRGHVNHAARIGAPIFCGRKCAGLHRRKHKTKDQKRSEKSEYDRQYRAKNLDKILASKAEYHKRTYDPKKAAIARKKRMHLHLEYCRRPEYRAKKAKYDLQYRAAEYGEFAECYILLLAMDKEVNSRMSDYDVRVLNGTLNKKAQRR